MAQFSRNPPTRELGPSPAAHPAARSPARGSAAAPAKPALTPQEAELAKELARVMSDRHQPPRRQPLHRVVPQIADRTAHPEPDLQALATAAELPPPPRPFPVPQTYRPDPDEESEAQDVTVRSVAWLRLSRRRRTRRGLAHVAAWSVTIVMISAIVGASAVALLGPERSLALLQNAQTQFRALAAAAQSVAAPTSIGRL
jgi:hypothetical protein